MQRVQGGLLMQFVIAVLLAVIAAGVLSGTTFLVGLGCTALAGVFAINVGFELLRYPLSGYTDKMWQPSHRTDMENALLLQLVSRVPLPPDDIRTRPMECVVKRPDGTKQTFSGHQIEPGMYAELPGATDGTPAPGVWCDLEPGEYEVRWYSSTPKGKFYEIAREKFQL